MTTDPVCKMNVEPTKAAAKVEYGGQTYYFCSESCHKSFTASPQQYVAGKTQDGSGHSGSHRGSHK